MPNYIDQLAGEIRKHVSAEVLPTEGDLRRLFRLYALLALSVGTAISGRDVHDAWCVWMLNNGNTHQSLVPYDALDANSKARDEPYVAAIRKVAEEKYLDKSDKVTRILLPTDGAATSDSTWQEKLFEQYKIMVQSSENLVARRQGVNTFFLTANGAFITAIGVLIKTSGMVQLKSLGVAAIALTGLILSIAWLTLLRSFGQLNTGKFAVINRLEKRLPASIYAAEWEALDRGENPKVYKSFTERESWTPKVLAALYIVTIIASAVFAIKGLKG